MKRVLLAVTLLLVLPLGISGATAQWGVPWYEARRDATGLAPDPATTREAVIQVYGARAVRWRGIFAVHTWVVVKPANADRYTRYEVIGWGVERGIPAVRIDRMGPDNHWFGAAPELILDRRGPEAEALIPKVQKAVQDYPWPNDYVIWPGPNSNTFTAWIGRQVPELRLDLPPTAIGKDFSDFPVGMSPSGTGVQLSLLGLVGGIVALEEGIEFNILGLHFGVDFNSPALRLPGIGRIGFPQN
jgi:hypothetical protein